MTLLLHFINSLAFVFPSWLVGLLGNGIIKNRSFYSKISHLNFIEKESTYKTIGMPAFKWMVKNTFFKYFNQKLKFESRPSTSELQDIRKEMTYSEISHFIGFIFILVIIVLKLINGQFIFALILFLLNIIFNLYPSLLQQQNKKQIDRILKL